MILLLGGTAETARIAAALAASGFPVLVSTATDVPLALPQHPRITRRCGRLDAAAMAALMEGIRCVALVDATHPYAVAAQDNAQQAARAAGIPYIRWQRPAASPVELEGALFAPGHEEAARLAFSCGRPVLLTVGSRNLAPYAEEAARTGLGLFVRVLPLPESLSACREAGLSGSSVIAARGPFSVEENRSLIRLTGAGVLVTKDGGAEGGLPAKAEAARAERCALVVVRRPPGRAPASAVFASVDLLAQEVLRTLQCRSRGTF